MIRNTLMTTAAALLAATAAQAASVTIDDFATTGFQVVGAPSLDTPSQNPATSSESTTDAIGGMRTIVATRTFPTGTANAFGQQVQAVVSSGEASVSLGANVQGNVEFQWNGGSSLGGVDLVDGTNQWVDITVTGADLAGVTYTLSLDSVGVTKTAVSGGTLRFNFSEFGAEDGTNVDAISLFITGPTSFDTAFTFIGAGGPAAVPLPAGGLLAMGGIAALGAVRARRNRKA